ncbi:conserved hypothetical protein, partial [Ricinus communis]
MGFGQRMQPVGLEQLRLVGHAVEHERHQRRLDVLAQRAVHGEKLVGIVAAIVGRHAHADQHHLGVGLGGGLAHGAQVGLGGRHRQAAQAVVGAQLDDHDVGLVLGQQRRQARAAAAGGLAADAGIDHDGVDVVLLQFLLGQRDPARAARQAIFGRQTISEHKH